MKHHFFSLLMALFFSGSLLGQEQSSYIHYLTSKEHLVTIHLSDAMLMHEMRETPSPLNNAVVGERAVSLMWPLAGDNQIHGSGLDGMETPKISKSSQMYRVRLSQDRNFKDNVIEAVCSWPFYNPEIPLADGVWYWQYGYVEGGSTSWSEVLKFTQEPHQDRFSPPSFKTFISKLPSRHPRVLVASDEWDTFISQSEDAPERAWYIARAEKTLKVPMKHIDDTDTSKMAGLDNEVKRNALLTRESRRIVDKEEVNAEVFVRAYLLTKDDRYYKEAMKRILEMIKWEESPNFVGDFNESALLDRKSVV